jgi:ribonuclease HI
MIYQIYCDGSTRGNGKENAVGAWAYVIINPQYNSMSFADVQAVKDTTNQRMELCAAIEAITKVQEFLGPFDTVKIYTDSAYLHNCYTQKWYRNWQMNGWKNAKKQPVANQDLWEMLIDYFESPTYEFIKVKGHADNMWNNYVDDLAQNASSKLKEKIDANCSN